MNDSVITHALGVGLLWQQEAGKHLLSSLLIHVLLKADQRLCLILRQPQSLQLTGAKSSRQVLQSVSIDQSTDQ